MGMLICVKRISLTYIIIGVILHEFIRRDQEKKKKDLTHFYDKSPYTDGKIKKQRDNTKTPLKSSTKQRLWADLGRSVGVMIATQVVWENQLTGSQSSHSP